VPIEPYLLDALRWPLEALSLLCLIGIELFAGTQWASLPDRVPMHFGVTGKPDRYGRRWTFLILPILSLVLYVMLSIPGETLGLLGGESASDTASVFMLAWTKLILLLLMGFCMWTIVRVAKGQARGMNVFVILLAVVLMMLPALTGLARD
jgi:uncharacterized membrane protein